MLLILTLWDLLIKKIIWNRRKLIEIYESDIFEKKFIVNPLKRVFEKLFALTRYYEDQGDEVMELFVDMVMNSLYAEQIRKDIEEECACISELRKLTEYDESVEEYWSIEKVDKLLN